MRNHPSSVSVLCPDVLAGHLLAAHPDLALLARWEGHLVLPADLYLEGREGTPDRTQPRPTTGSSLAKASRWSSGVSMAMVELVSVSP